MKEKSNNLGGKVHGNKIKWQISERNGSAIVYKEIDQVGIH